MKSLCNRFAFVPHMCDQCRWHVWMELYREEDSWKSFVGRYVRASFCKECAQKIIGNDLNDNEGI